MKAEFLVMLTTSTHTHLNTSRRVDSLESACQIARQFISDNHLIASDLRGDFGEIHEIKPSDDEYGDLCKLIGYVVNGKFEAID